MCKTIEITEKRCSKCGEVKPVEEFSKQKKNKDGFRCRCKKCRNADYRKYKEKNPEKIRKIQKTYKEKNIDKIKEKNRIYREKNREKERERCRIYREKNREKERERYRIYYEKNREKKREKYRIYYEKNRNVINLKNKSYRRKHSLRYKKIIDDWWRKNMQNLSDSYIKILLVKRSEIGVKELENFEKIEDILQLKRLVIQSKRILNHKKIKV